MRNRHSTRAALLGWSLTAFLFSAAAGGPPPLLDRGQPHAMPPPPELPMTADFAVPVLMYHRISELPPDAGPLLRDLTVHPEQFERQIRYLVQNRYHLLTAGEVERAVRFHRSLPIRSVALTLDDGYDDNFTNAFPILHRFGLDGTLFLVTGTVDTPGHVTWDDAREMQAERMEFGSHTVHHFHLTTLATPDLDEELIGSRERLERELSVPIEQIAYPSGQYNQRVKDRARRAGYAAGWKKGGGWVTPDSDPLMLPRVRVRGDTTMAEFIRKVTHRQPTQRELASIDSGGAAPTLTSPLSPRVRSKSQDPSPSRMVAFRPM